MTITADLFDIIAKYVSGYPDRPNGHENRIKLSAMAAFLYPSMYAFMRTF